jgi:hypothetical protein
MKRKCETDEHPCSKHIFILRAPDTTHITHRRYSQACTTNILARAVHKNILPGARPDTQANLHS